jgi:predicted amidohydrolase
MPAADAVVIACCQLGPRIGDTDRNRAVAQAAIVGAAARGAQVIVLPELVNSGYVFADADETRALAEPVDGETMRAWAKLAREHEIVIVGGICEGDDHAQALWNTAVVVDPDGLRAAYRKAHLWDRESLVFTAGELQPPVLDTIHGRIGVMICYDLGFPNGCVCPRLLAPSCCALRSTGPGLRIRRRSARRRSSACRRRRRSTACLSRHAIEWVASEMSTGPEGR